jgi:hypothetical protein
VTRAGFFSGNQAESLEHVDLEREREPDQEQRGERARDRARDRAVRGEPPPEDREHERRKVRGGGDREGEGHHERDVLAFERDPERDREDAECDGRDTRHAELLVRFGAAAAHHVHPEVVRALSPSGSWVFDHSPRGTRMNNAVRIHI